MLATRAGLWVHNRTMFRAAITELFSQQRARLENAVGPQRVEKAFAALESLRLDCAAIDASCCKELKHILQKKYEGPVANSTRLGGLGWSMAHVQDHMRRHLQALIRRAGDIMRAHVEAVDVDVGEGDAMMSKVECDLEPDFEDDVLQVYEDVERSLDTPNVEAPLEMASDLNELMSG